MSSVTIAKFYTSDYDTNARIEIVVEWRKHAFTCGRQGFIVSEHRTVTGGPPVAPLENTLSKQLGIAHTAEGKAIASALRHYRKLRAAYNERVQSMIQNQKQKPCSPH